MVNTASINKARPEVSEAKDYFNIGDKKYFFLADTVWNAFLNASLKEWEEYLDFRRMQNFNALQISVLPILHDASESKGSLQPFHFDKKGNWEFSLPNEDYFGKAETMVAMAHERGFTPALVVLWCNYVKGTWASEKVYQTYIMPLENVRNYTEYVVKKFKKYNPIYIISGDTNFPSDIALSYFKAAIKTVKEIDPAGLTTLHLQPHVDLHDDFINSVDFYMYQSGHMYDQQTNAYKLAENFYSKKVKRPIVNGEPCYEGHGHGNTYGRFTAFDVRKAAWQSILSGAKAGFTYGAHGLWSWHKKGDRFNNRAFSDIPLDWRSALRLQGAWDISFVKWLFEKHDLFNVVPLNKVANDTEEIRMAASVDGKKVVIYIPYLTEVEIIDD